MVGIHNVKIYTVGDNPWCETCLNGEKVVGDRMFKDGAYVCHCGGIPTEEKCDYYIKRKSE